MVGLWSIIKFKKPSIPISVNPRSYTQKLISRLPPSWHDQEHRRFSTSPDGMDVDLLTDCLLEMNQEAGNPALFGLDEDYSQSSLMTLDYYESLIRWLENERELKQAALKDLSDRQHENYECRLNLLQPPFKETCDSFTKEISTKFQVVYTQQSETKQIMQQQDPKFHKKLKYAKAWIKLSTAIFIIAFVAVIVCSVVAAVMACTPFAAGVAIATTLPLGSFGKWMNSRLKKHEQASKRKMEAVGAMLKGSNNAIKELDRIKAMIDGLEVQINSLLLNPETAITEAEGVHIVKMMQEFMTNMVELANQAEGCRASTENYCIRVLKRIIETFLAD